jgi:hypothetical protein
MAGAVAVLVYGTLEPARARRNLNAILAVGRTSGKGQLKLLLLS